MQLDIVLLWLWCRLMATAPIQPLAWELPYASGAALKAKKKKKKTSQGVPPVAQQIIGISGALDTGLIPGPAQWVKDPVLLQLQQRFQLQLGSDPWPRSFICLGGGGGAK